MRTIIEHASAAPFVPGFWAVMRREIHIIAHSPFYLLFTFILPLLSFAVLGAQFHTETPRDLPVLVCDRDGSSLSRQVARMVDASSALAIAGTVQDVEEGAARIREGQAYALFYLPAGLDADVKRGEAPAVTVYYNNQWLLVSGVMSRAARDVIATLSARLDIRFRMAGGESADAAAQHYEPIRLDVHPLFNPNLNYRYFLLPALLPGLIQVFLIAVTVRALGGELRHGTAGIWLARAGNRTWVAVFAKLLPYGLSFMVLTMFMLALLVRFFNVPLYGSMGVIVAASVLFVLAYQAMGFAMVALSANLRMANSLAGFYTGPALAFAGITYPALGMPLAAKIWSNSLPLTHYLYLLLQQALRGAPPNASAPSLLVLLLFAVLPFALLLKRMGRLMREPKYWGRV